MEKENERPNPQDPGDIGTTGFSLHKVQVTKTSATSFGQSGKAWCGISKAGVGCFNHGIKHTVELKESS